MIYLMLHEGEENILAEQLDFRPTTVQQSNALHHKGSILKMLKPNQVCIMLAKENT